MTLQLYLEQGAQLGVPEPTMGQLGAAVPILSRGLLFLEVGLLQLPLGWEFIRSHLFSSFAR